MNPQTTASTQTDLDAAAADFSSDIQKLKDEVDKSPMPEELRDKIAKMLLRLTRMTETGNYSQEFESVEQYIRWAVQVPWGKVTKDELDMENAKVALEDNHYGLQHVKDAILEYLAVMKLQRDGYTPEMQQKAAEFTQAQAAASQAAAMVPQVQVMGAAGPSQPVIPVSEVPTAPAASAPVIPPQQQPVALPPVPATAATPVTAPLGEPVTKEAGSEMSRLQGSSSHAPILCFVGIQGVGKTSIAKSIGTALGRPFIRVALGAMGSVTQLRGIARTQPGAEPGQIIKALVRAGTMNPLILLDELDKTSSESGLRADIMAALLEILDPEQNSTFVDHYLDFPVDLSKVIFITTANNLGGISAALLDRLEVIRFSSYTDDDKIQIARNYMLPKVREATGITKEQLDFDDNVWPLVVRPLGFDAGVRQLERTLTILARKVARMIVEGKGTSFRVTTENFREFIPEDIGVYS